MQHNPKFQNLKWISPAVVTALATWFLPFIEFPFNADFIKNPDAAVRLERVRQLVDGHGWFNLPLLRVSTLEGQVLHWTRPLDVLVGIWAWPLSTVMSSHDAVLYGSLALSLCTVLVGVFAIYGVMVMGFQVQPWAGGLAALSIVTMADMLSIFAPSSGPDHHALLLILFIASVGFCLEGAIKQNGGYALGIVFALALWVSPESFVPLSALYGGFVLLWIKDGTSGLAGVGVKSAVALSITLMVALAVEFGPVWPNMALDRLSGFTLLSAALILGFWASLQGCPQAINGHWIKRTIWVVLVALMALGLLVMVVPNIQGGPMANADPWFIKYWGNFFGDGFRLSVWDGGAIIYGALAILWLFKLRPYSYLLTPVLLVSLLLSKIDSTRWIVYGEGVAGLVLVYGFSRMWPTLKGMGNGIKGVSVRVVAVTSMCLLPMMLGILARPSSAGLPKLSITGEDVKATACHIEDILPALKAFKKTRILAHPNITPALLFFTKHDVMAIPIHPNGEAVHDSVRVFTSTNNQKALDILKRYGVGLVVFCPSGHEQLFYGRQKNGLYVRTLNGHGPDWLQPLDIKQGGYKVYAVKNSP